jgi:hypothetical protein
LAGIRFRVMVFIDMLRQEFLAFEVFVAEMAFIDD